MEQILAVLEGQLRRFRRNSAALAAEHPLLARQLGPAEAVPDAHVDRIVQGVASLHARTALALERAGWQRDEHLLELLHPQQLRPFPACRIGPAPNAPPVALKCVRFCGPELELDFEWEAAPDVRSVDIYLEGDASFCAALRSALLRSSFLPCGLDPAEALLPRPPGGHAGLALLREFFVAPERFNFVRLDLRPYAGVERWTLRVPLPDIAASRLLRDVGADHLRVGWGVRARLAPAAAAPILLDGRQAEYLLSVPPELEIFSIDRVQVNGREHPWVARRAAGAVPGHEWRIAFNGGAPVDAVASVDVSCCHRADVLARPAGGAGCRWQLNSLLALDMLPLNAPGLRELMATQAINRSPASQAMIAAVKSLTAHPALLKPERAAPVPGTELHLQVDASPFAGCGLLLFAQVMDCFFGECAHLNTFTRLVLVSAGSGEELIRCRARNAGTVLE
ncbi:type VI secretion system baseplate subunit TssF [Pseudoduganella sp. OTU4001]|uniref:type VI secretion system baseplate subunit TssF n=1 Tax=Pseudoduganella sp. OTU4001 TaxID=3043854 RepID=UPI00313B482F